jgi:hypothetical protein
MSVKVDIPKKKPNHFCVYNHRENNYSEVRYLTQQELAEGWVQVIPNNSEKKLINHFNVTLAYLPESLWGSLRKDPKNNYESYAVIKDGLTRYTIQETNQDAIMIKLFNEIRKMHPDKQILQNCIDELDISIHNSWLVLRAKHFINSNCGYFQHVLNSVN